MVFIKRMNNADTGDATHLGGDNWDLLDQYHDDIDIETILGKPAKINTRTELRDGKLLIKNPANTAAYTLKGGSISSNVNLFLPTLTADGTLVAAGGANDWGNVVQTFRSSNIAFRNPANTASYIHVTSAITANRNITWPLLTADDTLVFNDFLATLKTKTLNIDENTLKHSTTNAQGDLYKYDTTAGKIIRVPRGSAGQVFKTNAGGTDVGWENETSATPTDVLYTNLKSSSGFKYGLWYGANTSTVRPGDTGLFANLENVSASASSYIDGTNGFSGLSYPMTSSSANAGWMTDDIITIRKLNPDLEVCFQLDEGGDDLGSRVWIGFTNNLSSGSFNSDTFLDNDIGVLLHKESTENFFKITSNDGDATQDESTSILTSDSNIHIIRIFATESATKWSYQLDGGSINDLTTEIPAATDNLGVIVNASQADSTSRNFRVFWARMKMKERV